MRYISQLLGLYKPLTPTHSSWIKKKYFTLFNFIAKFISKIQVNFVSPVAFTLYLKISILNRSPIYGSYFLCETSSNIMLAKLIYRWASHNCHVRIIFQPLLLVFKLLSKRTVKKGKKTFYTVKKKQKL